MIDSYTDFFTVSVTAALAKPHPYDSSLNKR
jgi:hypothetical protein